LLGQGDGDARGVAGNPAAPHCSATNAAVPLPQVGRLAGFHEIASVSMEKSSISPSRFIS